MWLYAPLRNVRQEGGARNRQKEQQEVPKKNQAVIPIYTSITLYSLGRFCEHHASVS